LAFRLTGDKRYRDYAWRIFQSIENYCRVDTGGYASIINVDEVPVRKEDKMETFLMVGFLACLHACGLTVFAAGGAERNLEVLVSDFRGCKHLALAWYVHNSRT
jgi:hypothetical protein